jgi:phosphoglycerol transferase MdoB-like AlkP superfamily enzyme
MDNTTKTVEKKLTASGLLKKYNITIEQADTLLEQIFDELSKEDDEIDEEDEEVEKTE